MKVIQIEICPILNFTWHNLIPNYISTLHNNKMLMDITSASFRGEIPPCPTPPHPTPH